MAQRAIILHVPAETLATLPLTSPFRPVTVWDNENRQFTNEQITNDSGIPVWEASALLGVGFSGEIETVKVRHASRTKPNLQPDPSKLMGLFGGNALPDLSND